MTALHGRGTASCSTRSSSCFPSVEPDDERRPSTTTGPTASLGVAIVGRPNVGKSTLFNRLVGEERAVVHDMPGTTRDAIDTVVETDDGPIRFVDTAGHAAQSRIDDGTEYYSLVRALEAVDRADVALLVIDATEGVTHQDQRLAERVDAAGLPDRRAAQQVGAARHRAAARHGESDRGPRCTSSANAPVLQISALTGKGVHKLLPVLSEAIEDYHRRVPTREVNEVIQAAQAAQPAPGGARVLYATRARPTRRRSRCSSTASCRRRTCATWKEAAGRLRPRQHAGQAQGAASVVIHSR